jgi:hypothetical protein
MECGRVLGTKWPSPNQICPIAMDLDSDKAEYNAYSMEDVLLTQYCAGGKIEKNEMGAYGGGERCAQGSGWET